MPLLFLLQKHHLDLQSLDSTATYIELVTSGHMKPSLAPAAWICEALSNIGPSYLLSRGTTYLPEDKPWTVVLSWVTLAHTPLVVLSGVFPLSPNLTDTSNLQPLLL